MRSTLHSLAFSLPAMPYLGLSALWMSRNAFAVAIWRANERCWDPKDSHDRFDEAYLQRLQRTDSVQGGHQSQKKTCKGMEPSP